MREQITALQTEGYDAAQADLDRRPVVEVVRAVVAGHAEVLAAVEAAAPAIAELVERAAERVAAGGRVVYAAAGSGAHIAAVDASEWGPTFSFDDALVLRAGAGSEPGSPAEAAAEDDARAGAADARALALRATDVVVGISASGRTPYVLAALEVAAATGALTGAVTSEPGSPLASAADCAIVVPVGAEVVAGSTRLKAGTAQKLVLNAFSTALMVRRGRTFGNLMAGMRVANGKLRERAVRVCELATGCTPDEARAALDAADAQVDVAILVLARGASAAEARERLRAHGGAIRATLDNWS
jgi:N-acetylmuramic acid 6-phosphate etherase